MNDIAAQQDFLAAAIRIAEKFRGSEFLPGEPNLVDAVDAFYAALPAPEGTPLAVRRAIVLKFVDDIRKAIAVLRRLQFDHLNGCYSFQHAGMYHGVEPDGYIHT